MSGSECDYLETLGYVHLSGCLIVDLAQLRYLFKVWVYQRFLSRSLRFVHSYPQGNGLIREESHSLL